jgi:lysylphosphatidylglycerol synthetase-like protein (DUF2156 family)
VSRAAPGPEDRHAHSPGTGGGAGAGCAEAVAGDARPAGRVLAALAGLREPVVWILLAIAFFTGISGKPVDGVLMLLVAVGLAWDAGRRALRHSDAADAANAPAWPARLRGGYRRVVVAGSLLAGAAIYAGVVGSFSRYSWPVTACIIVLGMVVVLIGWHGPVRARPAGGRLPVAGTLAWIAVLVAGCLWELGALLQQPSLTTDSYSHPTISTLTDPVLATSPCRAVILLAWLALGWYLVER